MRLFPGIPAKLYAYKIGIPAKLWRKCFAYRKATFARSCKAYLPKPPALCGGARLKQPGAGNGCPKIVLLPQNIFSGDFFRNAPLYVLLPEMKNGDMPAPKKAA